MKRYIKSSNGSLYNNDHGLYYRCLNQYKVTFRDGTVRYTRAKNAFEAEQNTCWINDEDRSEDIISVEAIMD